MTFVFCSLLELAWVGYLSREEEYSPPPSAVALPTKTLPIPPLTSNKTTPVAPPTPSHQVHSATSTLHREKFMWKVDLPKDHSGRNPQGNDPSLRASKRSASQDPSSGFPYCEGLLTKTGPRVLHGPYSPSLLVYES
ncbi:hypothetical protein ANCDUO_26542 [Ancylostoma duodenale]|uniref:Uncharacterized protein n=1 Tax=Ancylostoma duodenale TaxID=51022 RepID=A0A0C2FEJ6_9BILA|nr:hypothetical protein ANCDUO_26542 [Ancylostoma duodenale]